MLLKKPCGVTDLQDFDSGEWLILSQWVDECCDSTVRDGAMRDFKVVFLSDCSASFSPEEQDATLKKFRPRYRAASTSAARRFPRFPCPRNCSIDYRHHGSRLISAKMPNVGQIFAFGRMQVNHENFFAHDNIAAVLGSSGTHIFRALQIRAARGCTQIFAYRRPRRRYSPE